MNAKSLWSLLKDTASEWVEDKAPRLGAALAYYTIFAIAPLLVIVIAVAGFVFGRQAAQGQIQEQIQGVVGEQGAKAIEAMVAGANKPAEGILATVLGVAMLLFGAMGLFGQLQDALNTVWEVEPKPGRGLWELIRDRLLSFTMVLGTAFLLLVSLAVSAALTALGSLMGAFGTSAVGQVVNVVISLVVITALFAMIFKFLPDAKIAWRDVWLGAAVTAVLFTAGKFLLGLYLGHSSVTTSYGPAGSFALLLIWIYYSAQIFLFGAELTKEYADRFGSRIKPAENAVPITEESRAQQGIPHDDGNAAGEKPASNRIAAHLKR